MNAPVRKTRAELLAILDDIRARVTAGDSFDGSLQYEASESDEGGFFVMATYRIGNLDGQGGYRLIGRTD
jgi:hypothetical protein